MLFRQRCRWEFGRGDLPLRRQAATGDTNLGAIHIEVNIPPRQVDVLPRNSVWREKGQGKNPEKHQYLWSEWERGFMKGH